ncbi:hypothetical protein BDW60DRAFT_207997 [Aspergillus nidulans var. acristatus]
MTIFRALAVRQRCAQPESGSSALQGFVLVFGCGAGTVIGNEGEGGGCCCSPTGGKSPSSSDLSSSSNDNAILDARTPSRDSPHHAAAAAADKEASADISKLAPARNPVEFLSGRPNVRAIVTAEAQEAKANSSRLAVLTCGPAQMADECRQTLYEVMRGKNGFRGVEYFEEALGWS